MVSFNIRAPLMLPFHRHGVLAQLRVNLLRFDWTNSYQLFLNWNLSFPALDKSPQSSVTDSVCWTSPSVISPRCSAQFHPTWFPGNQVAGPSWRSVTFYDFTTSRMVFCCNLTADITSVRKPSDPLISSTFSAAGFFFEGMPVVHWPLAELVFFQPPLQILLLYPARVKSRVVESNPKCF